MYKCEIDIMNEDKKLLNRVRYDDTKPAGDDWEEVSQTFSKNQSVTDFPINKILGHKFVNIFYPSV